MINKGYLFYIYMSKKKKKETIINVHCFINIKDDQILRSSLQ